MTLEEKSKKYVFSNPPSVVIDNHSYFLPSDLKRAYLVGAKENGIVWHDLRKDPNDLPKETLTVLINAYDYGISGYYIAHFLNGKWWSNVTSEIFTGVIAWCEIPQFEGVAE